MMSTDWATSRLLVRPIGSSGSQDIAEINLAWDYVTAIYSRNEENLSDLMNKVLKFHETLHVCFPVISLVPTK
jgi:hypothetical protein